jgi:hypothetical protein
VWECSLYYDCAAWPRLGPRSLLTGAIENCTREFPLRGSHQFFTSLSVERKNGSKIDQLALTQTHTVSRKLCAELFVQQKIDRFAEIEFDLSAPNLPQTSLSTSNISSLLEGC